MTEMPSEMVITGFVAMGAAVAWLAVKWEAGNNRCEDRSTRLEEKLSDLTSWNQTVMLSAINDMAQAMRQLKHEVRELDPSDANDSESDIHKTLTGHERQVIERHDNGETTAIIRRIK
jgi:hypothetical protein